MQTAKLGTEQQSAPLTLDGKLSEHTSCLVRAGAPETATLHYNSFCCSDAK
jgi:hypothetical protein